MRINTLVLLGFAALLAGCASTRLDANVHTLGAWPTGRVPGTFAFERLPSQEARATEQDRLESDALPAIERAGFSPAAAEPADVVVQVAARTLQGVMADPFYGPVWGGGVGIYGGRGGMGFGGGWGFGATWGVPYSVYEVSLLILDARTRQSLYEARAQSDGSRAGERVWAALAAAALKDFPYAAVSPRQVTVDLPK